jgi:hypothetical protein
MKRGNADASTPFRPRLTTRALSSIEPAQEYVTGNAGR